MVAAALRGLAAAALLTGCAPLGPPPAVTPPRELCGWEQLTVGEPVLKLTPTAVVETPVPGHHRVVIAAADAVRLAQVAAALAPLRSALVRVEAVLDGRWLLPMTLAGRRPLAWPPGTRIEQTIVGSRRVTRPVGAPADRLAELSLEAGRVRLAVESDNPRGRWLPVGELAAALRREEPAIASFMLAARPETTWSELLAVLRASACYDRRAGQEPHEVILALP